MSFTNLLIVAAVAFAAPLLANLAPRLRVPSPVLEILAGIVLGPSALGWVSVDAPVQVLSLLGLSWLLFLAGLEIDVHQLRGRPLRLATVAFLISIALAVLAGLGLDAVGLTKAPLFLAVALLSTSLGLVVPVLKDAGEIASPVGQLIVVAASIADFAAVILLSLLFSKESSGIGGKALLLGGLVAVAVVCVLALTRAGRAMSTMAVFGRLQDTTAQIRIRFDVVLLVAFVALAQKLGLEAILGAFLAGVMLKLIDPDGRLVHPHTELKLDAIGFGFVIPVFFVASGLRFDVGALFASAGTVARVPVFLLALVVARGLPALVYRSAFGLRTSIAAALLQATSLPFIVAAVMIGSELGLISAATGAGLIAAGLLSVLLFPPIALALLKGGAPAMPAARDAEPAAPRPR